MICKTIRQHNFRYSADFDIINYVNCPETSNTMCGTGIWRWLRCPKNNVIMPNDEPTVGDEVVFSNTYRHRYIAFDVAFYGTDSKLCSFVFLLMLILKRIFDVDLIFA